MRAAQRRDVERAIDHLETALVQLLAVDTDARVPRRLLSRSYGLLDDVRAELLRVEGVQSSPRDLVAAR
jgi:hypothetical protein